MWTEADITLVQQWAMECQSKRMVYDRAAAVYSRRQQLLKYPMMILGACATSTMFMSFVSNVVVKILVISWLVVTGINNASKFMDEASNCRAASNVCQRVVMKVQRQMSRRPAARGDPEVFKATVSALIQGMVAPDLPYHVERDLLHDIDMYFRSLPIPVSGALVTAEDKPHTGQIYRYPKVVVIP